VYPACKVWATEDIIISWQQRQVTTCSHFFTV
jgi:hypothetical protein